MDTPPPTPEPTTKNTCPYCSEPISAGQTVCSSCGRWLDSPQAANADTSKHNRQTLTALMAIGGVIVILLCAMLVIGYWLINQQNKRQEAESATRTAIEVARTATGQVLATQAQATLAASATQEAQALNDLYNRASQWEIVIADSFDADTDSWYTGESEDEFSSGVWEIKDGAYQVDIDALSGFSQWMWPDNSEPDLSNFYLSASIAFNDGPETMDGGLIFHLQEDNQFYLFDIYNDGDYAVYRRSDSDWETIIEATPSASYLPGEANTLEVIAIGNEFTLLLNHEKQTTFQDETLQGGRAGIAVGLAAAGDHGVWLIDNFMIRAPVQK